MMQFPPLKTLTPIGSEGVGVWYLIVSSVIISKVQLGISSQESVHITGFFLFFFPLPHQFASITAVPHQAIRVTYCSLNWSPTRDLPQSIGDGSVWGTFCFNGIDGERGGGDKRCGARSQIPIVILCRGCVLMSRCEEWWWMSTFGHVSAPELVPLFSRSLVLRRRQRKQSPLKTNWIFVLEL